MSKARTTLVAVGVLVCQSLSAAPLDELLAATHTAPEIEAGYDQVNRTVDIFRIRERDSFAAGTALGDYSGFHLIGGIPLLERHVWLDGALWQRKLNIASLGAGDARITSWSAAGQYRVARQVGNLPDLGLRLSAWGDASDSITKESPTTFNAFTVARLEVGHPRDRQLQADVVASWGAGRFSGFNAFAGIGSSTVDFDSVRAFQGSCEYAVTSPSDSRILMDTRSPGCNAVLIQNRGAFAPKYNTNNFRYHARSLHFGGSYTLVERRWRFRAGYRWEKIIRALDDDIAAVGGAVVNGNVILTGEIGYRIAERIGVVVRGHYFTRQLNGEIPFTYNAFTADKFNHRYGLVTTALVFAFD